MGSETEKLLSGGGQGGFGGIHGEHGQDVLCELSWGSTTHHGLSVIKIYGVNIERMYFVNFSIVSSHYVLIFCIP